MEQIEIIGINDAIKKGFETLGFSTFTDIQKIAIPVVASNKDAYITAATGSGKTYAYLAPILSAIKNDKTLQAVIITPTPDLAAQIERVGLKLAKASDIPLKMAVAIGSIPIRRQLDRLSEKPQIVVGSSGRIRDLVENHFIKLDNCKWAILDEADRLFENEALEMTSSVLERLPDTCARVLVSATIPQRTINRSAKWFRNAQKVEVNPAKALQDSIESWCFYCSSRDKTDFLRRFEAAEKPTKCLIFASTNAQVFTLQNKLPYFGFPVGFLTTEEDGSARKNAIHDFAEGKTRYLVTTDLGARGLDIEDISHVISFDIPEEPTIYIHRAGRTGRAGKKGICVSLADMVELKRASKLAVRYQFNFKCKILANGQVCDIPIEEFFELAEKDDQKRQKSKHKNNYRRR